MSLHDLNIFSVPGLGIALDAPVRPKKSKTRDIKDYSKGGAKGSSSSGHAAKLLRVINKTPEVMVKVSGSGKSQGHTLAHMTYITRNGKLEAENERGESIDGAEEVKELFDQWGFEAKNSEKSRSKSVHIVLSMPEGTDPNAVMWAARKFAQERFSKNHQYLMVLHTDTPHPHVHLAVKAQGFDMTWVKRSKADLQEWREMFAEKLREQGIAAEATPRRARGVVQKGKTQPMYHMTHDKDKSGNARTKGSIVIRQKVEEAIREIDGQGSVRERPWEKAIVIRQEKVLGAYGEIKEHLSAATDEDSRRAAAKLTKFLKDLPPLETERVKLKRQLVQVMEAQGTGRGVSDQVRQLKPLEATHEADRPKPAPGRGK